jgi:hypothetical protein
MVNRLIGIVTLKAPVYKEVAEDQSATSSAAIVVVVAAIVGAVGLILGGADAVGSLLTQILGGLLGWVVGSWVIALVAKMLGGDTNTGEMLRVNGYVRVFGVVGILAFIPAVGGVISLVVAVLNLIGSLIGIREAAGFSTGKAIVAAIIAAIVTFLVVMAVGLALAAVGIGAAAVATTAQ